MVDIDYSTDPNFDATYRKVELTAASDFEEGKYLIINNVIAMINSFSAQAGTLAGMDVVIRTDNKGNHVGDPNEAIIWKFTKIEDGVFTITDKDGKFLTFAGSGELKLADDMSPQARWVPDISNGIVGFHLDGAVNIAYSSYWFKHNGTGFRTVYVYSGGAGLNLTFYKFDEAEIEPFEPAVGDFIFTDKLENGVYVIAGVDATKTYRALDEILSVGIYEGKEIIIDENNRILPSPDKNLQWAIVKQDDGYCIFGLTIKKYLSLDGSNIAMSDELCYWIYDTETKTFELTNTDNPCRYIRLNESNQFVMSDKGTEIVLFKAYDVEAPELPKSEKPESQLPTHTIAQEVYDSFEASFQDKSIIPESLEFEWLRKAVARYSIEIDPIGFDERTLMFDTKLDRYVVDTLAALMKQSYQEREVSKVNKRVSIVSKDLSIDGNNGSKSAARNELLYDESKANQMLDNQKPTAYV